MDKLLNWSIAQQSGDKEAISKVGEPDPKMLQQLFGGPDEPALMKEAIAVLENKDATEEDKEIAFENFEMLIENLDNANNIENLGLWPSIIRQLSLDVPSTLRIYAASSIGVAVQNNSSSQEAFLRHDGGVKSLISACKEENVDAELHSKALFALSSLLRNFKPACEKFDELHGWSVLDLEKYASHKLQLRVLSLISAILSTGLDRTKEALMREHKLVCLLILYLDHETHVGCVNKTLNILAQLADLGFVFSVEEESAIRLGLEKIAYKEEQLSSDDYEACKNIQGR